MKLPEKLHPGSRKILYVQMRCGLSGTTAKLEFWLEKNLTYANALWTRWHYRKTIPSISNRMRNLQHKESAIIGWPSSQYIRRQHRWHKRALQSIVYNVHGIYPVFCLEFFVQVLCLDFDRHAPRSSICAHEGSYAITDVAELCCSHLRLQIPSLVTAHISYQVPTILEAIFAEVGCLNNERLHRVCTSSWHYVDVYCNVSDTAPILCSQTEKTLRGRCCSDINSWRNLLPGTSVSLAQETCPLLRSGSREHRRRGRGALVLLSGRGGILGPNVDPSGTLEGAPR